MTTERARLPRGLRPFVDGQGRLTAWPAKQSIQKQAIALIATKLDVGREYSEREINELLQRWHTFDDWALLRRLLFDWRFVDREPDGSRYRLRREAPWRLEVAGLA
jgi:hypothetical protein